MTAGLESTSTDTLTPDALRALLAGDVVALHVPGFYDPVYAEGLSDLLQREIDDDTGGGIYESNIDSYWNVMKDEDRRERYLEVALPLQARLRRLSAPHPSPVDLLRSVLDEIWPGGATLKMLEGRKMPFGITRLWRQGSEALPHQDVFWRELAGGPQEAPLTAQLGVNIYLDTAERGGELEVWDHVISDDEYAGIRDRFEGSYGFPREMLPASAEVIDPEVGDLVLVNTLRVHAVRRIESGRRLTVSGFVGASSETDPLLLWS